MISMISSVGKNGELGRKNELIWHIPKDMKFFKNTTMGHVVVMGKNTYESLPGDLPGRKMVVLSFDKIIGNVETVYSVEEILDKYLDKDEEVFIIGGASIYSQFIKYANKLYLTEIDDECSDADTFFPEFDKNEWDREVVDTGNYNGINFEMCKYIRKS